MDVTRYHTCKKELLRFSDVDLDKMDSPEFKDFLVYVDAIDQVDIDAMTTGQWKKLFACLKKVSNKTQINYCIYENPHAIQFDITSHCIGTPADISGGNMNDVEVASMRTGNKESALEKLKRYKDEVIQIDLKIKHLQERRKEYVDKMEPLKMELATLLDDLIRIDA